MTINNWPTFRIHNFARIFRQMRAKEFAELVNDIRERDRRQHVVLDPILLFQNRILDGRSRYMACRLLAKRGHIIRPPRTANFAGTEEEARERVVALNIGRQDLTQSQKAMGIVLAGLVSLPRLDGGRRAGRRDEIEKIADRYGVSHPMIYAAAIIVAHDKSLATRVVAGEWSVVPAANDLKKSRHAEQVSQSGAKQSAMLQKMSGRLERAEKSMQSVKRLLDQVDTDGDCDLDGARRLLNDALQSLRV